MVIDEGRAQERGHDARTLRDALDRTPFPAQRDDLLVELVHHHVPPPLLARIRGLPQTRSYHSIDDLCAEIER